MINQPADADKVRYDVEVKFTTIAEIAEAKAFVHNSQWFLPFQNPDWCRAWQDFLGPMRHASPVTAVVRQDGAIVAVLPMSLKRTRLLQTLTWHAESLGDYGSPVLSGDGVSILPGCNIAALLTDVASKIGGVDVICLSKQPSTLFGRANSFVLPGSVQHHVGAHAINFQPGECWDDFLRRTRSSSTRQQLRKKQRNLAKLGTVEFRVATTQEEASVYIRHCLDAKSKQLAKLGHFDPFTSPANRALIEDYFTRNVADSTWALALTLNGKPVSSAFGFAGAQQWLLYQMAMDGGGTAQTSPGTQMLMCIMQHCIVKKITRLDLAMGDEGYKQEWCDEHQTLFNSFLCLSGKGLFAGQVMRQLSIASRKIASHEQLYNLAKSAKRNVQKLLARG